MDKRDRSESFRARLHEAMQQKNMTRSALARATRVDRSTIGQLLNGSEPRLPNGQLVADLARALGVSTDWLLSLTNRPERPGDIVAAAMALSPAERSSADAQLLEWHREATGHKVRHVPATLPDMLKTDEMLKWEYSSFRDQRLEQGVEAIRAQLEWLRSSVSDYEIALPLHELHACAEGTGYYHGLDPAIRHAQLTQIARACDELFPRLRLYVFDAHTEFSAPITVFGTQVAVVYVGQCYLAFRGTERVRTLTAHFDWLVREAKIDARQTASHIRGLMR